MSVRELYGEHTTGEGKVQSVLLGAADRAQDQLQGMHGIGSFQVTFFTVTGVCILLTELPYMEVNFSEYNVSQIWKLVQPFQCCKGYAAQPYCYSSCHFNSTVVLIHWSI